MEKHLNVPANTEELAELKSGDYVYLTGTIYTARDAAHKRMYETLLDLSLIHISEPTRP